jgi:subtilisin family serine protease
MTVNPADLDRIAALDSVQAIETITPAAPYNDIIKEISGINSTNSDLQKSNKPLLTGKGQVVGLADSGVDPTHPAFKDKIVDKFYLFGEEKDEGGHGTHVAGTILGSPMTSFDSKDCAGMAPSAHLCVQGGMFRKMPKEKRLQASQLFDKAYKTFGVNCRIHNNSWGSAWSVDQRNSYALKKQKLPQFAYSIDDAEPVDQFAIEHPDFLILFAAGNNGLEETDTGAQLGGWAAAKNVLTVGATNTNRPMSGGLLVDYSTNNQKLFDQKDPKAYRRGTIAPFSSIGPCKNSRRTKPDVLAPGAGILSARSKDVDPKVIEEWGKGYGVPPKAKAGDQTIFMSGTSMATPAVSGYAALLREALVQWQGMTQPVAPLMKALFINGTDVLPNTPRKAQGFGEINMIKVLRPVHMKIADITAGKAASGWTQDVANKNTSVKVVKAVAPHAVSGKTINMKVTLVYHDRPGDQIQNRMNLFVERAGKARTDTLPTTPYDNVHQLIIGPLTEGETLTIGVEKKLFVGGALPQQGSMPWAVVWDCFYVQAPTLPVQAPTLPVQPPTLPVQPPTLPVQPPTLPVQPPGLSQLESLVNGQWRGYYYYNNGSTDTESVFTLSTKRTQPVTDAVTVEGSGEDSAGSFVIQGKVDTSGRITFTKLYPARGLSWTYSGHVDQSQRVMSGSWGEGKGTFSFRRTLPVQPPTLPVQPPTLPVQPPTLPVQPPGLSQLESLVNGQWRGYYYYSNGSTDTESVFTLSTKRTQQVTDAVTVEGSGGDSAGSFVIQGKVDTSGRITFTKLYPARGLPWTYSGHVDQSQRAMSGSWGEGRGTFSFRRT